MRRRGRRLSSRRGVLEGLPLSILISFLIIAIGTAVIFGVYAYTRGQALAGLTLGTPYGTVQGPLAGPWPEQLTVTALAENGGTISGVTILTNGSGENFLGVTPSNGTLTFLLNQPKFATDATSGIMTVTATYTPSASLSGKGPQVFSTSVVIL